MIEVKIWDIIKLKDYASSPQYTYLVLWVDIEVTLEAWKINKEEWYIKILRLNSFIETPTEIEKEIFWWKQIETSFISKNSIEKILFNIWIW